MGIVYTLDTPSLLLDYQKLIKNMVNIADFAKKQGISYRPHIKTHKSVKIAQLQLEAGAIGITCAKISEAEVMAAAGIKDILIAYPISSPDKIKRVIDLLQQGVHLKVSVDNTESLEFLQKELEHSPFALEVWIKVNSGLNRCGVEPGQEAVHLAKAIMSYSRLNLGGIFTHAGHSYGAESYEEIEAIGIQEGTDANEQVILGNFSILF
jgi:D-serine deaminase-like pyridoxal phosphate-dependent protein